MPALHPTPAAARRAASLLRDAGKGTSRLIGRAAASDMFMPAFGQAASTLPIPSTLVKNNETKTRSYSKAPTAPKAATTVRGEKGVRFGRGTASDNFMPAFGKTVGAVVSPADTTVSNSTSKKIGGTKRNFSSAIPHEHDKVREQFKNNSVLDYWKEYPKAHINIDQSECVDYWKDYMNSHVAVDDSVVLHHHGNFSEQLIEEAMKNVPVHRNFSTESYSPAANRKKEEVDGEVIDYWTRHNDTHFTDYWEEHDHAHL